MRRHLFICTNARNSGKPACGARGGLQIQAEVSRLLIEQGAPDVLVTATACLGPCFDGPNAVIYPDGVWYGDLTVDDAPAITTHLIDGTVHAAKAVPAPGSTDRDD
ncbi:MAG: ferredoxin [Kofleriaceae bacterium]